MPQVLPPRVAPVQVVIIPIMSKACPLEHLQPHMAKVKAELKAAGLRCKIDDRDNQSPGWKFNHWEQKGVPLRVETRAGRNRVAATPQIRRG